MTQVGKTGSGGGMDGLTLKQGLRQEVRQQNRASGDQQALLEDALQLADVSRPGVAFQRFQYFRRYTLHVFTQHMVKTPHIVMNQKRQVVAAVAKGGQIDGEDAQAIEKV